MTDITPTLGKWSNGTLELTASYQEPGYVRIDTVDGPQTLTNEQWLRRYDAIRDAGGRKVA